MVQGECCEPCGKEPAKPRQWPTAETWFEAEKVVRSGKFRFPEKHWMSNLCFEISMYSFAEKCLIPAVYDVLRMFSMVTLHHHIKMIAHVFPNVRVSIVARYRTRFNYFTLIIIPICFLYRNLLHWTFNGLLHLNTRASFLNKHLEYSSVLFLCLHRYLCNASYII